MCRGGIRKLLEYQSKEILRQYGIPTPEGVVLESPREVPFSGHVYVKAQLPFTGRKSVGAVLRVESSGVRKTVTELLNKKFKGFRPKKVLVEVEVPVQAEIMVGITINYSRLVKGPEIVASPLGGSGVEERTHIRIPVDYLDGPPNLTDRLRVAGFPKPEEVNEVIQKMYRIFVDYDARSVEINPLALVDGRLMALDARIDVDDHALFRQEVRGDIPKDLNRDPSPLELAMWKWDDADPRGTGYFILLPANEPYVGFHGIGGGGAMLAADALIRKGINIANYADTSGDPPASKVYRVIKTILSIPNISGYIMMGSVMASQEQWHHAHALVKAFREMLKDKEGFPALILLAGNKEKESHEIIRRGLRDLPIRYELYGRDYIYETDFIADRMLEMVKEYRGIS